MIEKLIIFCYGFLIKPVKILVQRLTFDKVDGFLWLPTKLPSGFWKKQNMSVKCSK